MLTEHEGKALLREMLRDLISPKHEQRCCPNCEYWLHTEEACGKISPAQRPPARVIAFGCPAFELGIPF